MYNIIMYCIIGIVAGALCGIFGIGGGIVIIPSLVYLLGFEQLKAQGTSLAVLLLPVGIFAFMEYYKNGHVDLKAGAFIIIFLIIGSIIGAKFVNMIPQNITKIAFGVLLLLVGIKMILGK